ncbi:MAG TPA: EcsC family protein [Myxococcaceae bacterium]|nr:EcsC family protein [Myxococcaceae bacterium]
MTEAEGQRQGRQLLTAVERIIADTDSLIALSQQHLSRARERHPDAESAAVEAAAGEVLRQFARRSAVSGGLTAAPALIPGLGSLVAAAGGTLADIGLVLKFEVEMALVLSHLYGFDITRPEERQIAFLLASVGTYDAQSGGDVLGELSQAARAGKDAVWTYAPREVSKMVLSVMAKIALLKLSKGMLARALPVVGIAVGSTMNHALTRRVGERCIRDLKTRRQLVKPRVAKQPQSAAPPRKSPKAKVGKPARKARKAP